jgi:hypothetical protein
MELAKYLTLDNVLKTLLAIAVGILLYNVFFKKTEGYYNYQKVDKVSDHAYPMDYEDDEYVAEEDDDVVVDPEDTEVVEEVFDDSEDTEVVDEVVLDDAVDEEMYEYEESEEPYDDSADAEDEAVGEIPDEIYEEADEEATESGDDVTAYNAYDFLYASDVEDGLQENFVLYENDVGVDTNYS